MKRRARTATRIWLVIGGVCASIAGGLMAGSYAVGGIDPFYGSRAASRYATPRTDRVAVVRDDELLPSTGIAAEPVRVSRITSPHDTATADWDAIDAKAQREMDRLLSVADAPLPVASDTASLPDPALSPPSAFPAPPPAPAAVAPPRPIDAPTRPVTPDGTLIY